MLRNHYKKGLVRRFYVTLSFWINTGTVNLTVEDVEKVYVTLSVTRDLGELVQNDAERFVGITMLKDCKHFNSLWADSAGT
jgi:hypothetical protein